MSATFENEYTIEHSDLQEAKMLAQSAAYDAFHLRNLLTSGHLFRYQFPKDMTTTHGPDQRFIDKVRTDIDRLNAFEERLGPVDDPMIRLCIDSARKDYSDLTNLRVAGGTIVSEPGATPSLEGDKERPDDGEE